MAFRPHYSEKKETFLYDLVAALRLSARDLTDAQLDSVLIQIQNEKNRRAEQTHG